MSNSIPGREKGMVGQSRPWEPELFLKLQTGIEAVIRGWVGEEGTQKVNS